MRIGSVFTGAGGLDLAVKLVFGAELGWVCETDPAAARVLEFRFPGVPNLGCVAEVPWSEVPPVDILCGGFPCTDVSLAGLRAGIHGTRSGLWSHMAEAIDVLRPQFVVIENVRGLLNANAHRPVESGTGGVGNRPDGLVLRAMGAVLGDLSDIGGYDARWVTVSAADAGAPHFRERVFILASRTGLGFEIGAVPVLRNVDLLPTPRASDRFGAGHHGNGSMDLRTTVSLLPRTESGVKWGKFAEAVKRWERLTRPAPSPVEPGVRLSHRLSAEFSSWMMGWPRRWVTDPAIGIPRKSQLKIIGNGVVPHQADLALRLLLDGRAVG